MKALFRIIRYLIQKGIGCLFGWRGGVEKRERELREGERKKKGQRQASSLFIFSEKHSEGRKFFLLASQRYDREKWGAPGSSFPALSAAPFFVALDRDARRRGGDGRDKGRGRERGE